MCIRDRGINFWPETIGRDKTRTPMVWDGSANGGFTGGNVKPWLPVKAPPLARNMESPAGVAGSVLETYREMMAFRRSSEDLMQGATRFFDLPQTILAFKRGDELVCLFNLSPNPVSLTVKGIGRLIGPAQAAALEGGALALGPNGFAFCLLYTSRCV